MWIVVMFDLPVKTKHQRKVASRFRKDLQDAGFDMIQFSVYSRPCPTEENAQVYKDYVRRILPDKGHVRIVQFTDKQYGRMECFYGNLQEPPEKQPEQLDLF